MKKKVLASAVAASLVLGSVAGLPLSTKGLLEKAGINVAHAAEGQQDLNSIIAELSKVYGYFWDGDQDVKDAKARLLALGDESVVAELAAYTGDQVPASEWLELFKRLGLFLNKNPEDLNKVLKDQRINEILDNIADAAGFSRDEISVQDAVLFAYGIESKLKGKLNLATLINDIATKPDPVGEAKAYLKKAVLESVEEVFDSAKGTYAFVDLLKSLELDGQSVKADAKSVVSKLLDAVDPDQKAVTSLGLAYIRYELNTSFQEIPNQPSNSRTKEYSYSIGGQSISKLLGWEAKETDRLTFSYNDQNNLVVTMSGTGTVSADIVGKIDLAVVPSLHGKELIRQEVSLRYNSDTSTGGGGGGGGFMGGSSIVDTTLKALDELKAKLENATDAEKAALIKEATQKVIDALAQIAKIDLSKKVTISDGKAIVNESAANLVREIKDIVASAKKLNDALVELGGQAQAVVLVFELSGITENAVEFPIAASVFQEVKQGNIGKVVAQLKGFGLDLNPAAFSNDTTISVSWTAASEVEAISGLPAAADVYDISFTSNDTEITEFSQPITLRFAVENSTRFDGEKLTLTKIENGQPLFLGGMLKGAEFKANRSHFSTYTVVQNDVQFNDIVSVRDWAGRQIEVAAAKGIVEGKGQSNFAPEDSVTRAEFAKMIINTFGMLDSNATESFSDVNDSDWFKPFVASAVKYGLVNGYGDGTFNPNGKITRAEMATIAARALVAFNKTQQPANPNAALADFKDAASIHETLKAGVALSAEQGIIIGNPDGTFKPEGDSTRAEAAVVIYRLLNKQQF